MGDSTKYQYHTTGGIFEFRGGGGGGPNWTKIPKLGIAMGFGQEFWMYRALFLLHRRFPDTDKLVSLPS